MKGKKQRKRATTTPGARRLVFKQHEEGRVTLEYEPLNEHEQAVEQMVNLLSMGAEKRTAEIERQARLEVDAAAYSRHLARRQQGIDNSKATRRNKPQQERLAIDKIKAESDERLSDKAACRIYLRKRDPAWKATSEEGRDRKVTAMAQRVSNDRRRARLEIKNS